MDHRRVSAASLTIAGGSSTLRGVEEALNRPLPLRVRIARHAPFTSRLSDLVRASARTGEEISPLELSAAIRADLLIGVADERSHVA